VVVTVFALLSGCSNTSTNSATKAAGKTYDLKGKVVALDPKKPSVTIDHEDITGLMKAMTMEYAVPDAKLLDGIAVGDSVRGKIRKDDAGYVITSLAK
jgi:protein SCO1/2